MKKGLNLNVVFCILCVVSLAGMFYFAKAGQAAFSNMCQYLTIIFCGLIFIPVLKTRYSASKKNQDLLWLVIMCFVMLIFVINLIVAAVGAF